MSSYLHLQSYFQVAARLGDMDAQQELAYCLANGKGCKKNLKEAAKWYRAAVSFRLVAICSS
jgi:TPR repeat protein